MSSISLHLTARDFDAYLPEKATSKAYSRPRLEVKQRSLAWGRRILERLQAQGIQADIHASDEHPTLRNKNYVDCQWLFFWRDEKAREELDLLLNQGRSISQEIDDPSPYNRHAFLAFKLDSKHVEVCFAVHPAAKVDIDNLKSRLQASAAGESAESPSAPLAAEFTQALKTLPEEFTIGVGESDRIACSTATPETIIGMLERAATGQTPLWIGWSIPRQTALDHADILEEQLEDALAALGPIYKLVAWSPENDQIAVGQRISGLEQERARTHAETTAQFERWQAEQEAQRERSRVIAQARSAEEKERLRRPAPGRGFLGSGSKRPSLDTLFKTPKNEAAPDKREAKDTAPKRAPQELVQPPKTAPAPTITVTEARFNKQAETIPAPPPAPSPANAADVTQPLEKGSRVRVKSGAFADKVGVISELDGRGGVRVLLGLLSTRLELSQLEPALDDQKRPALQSSHRKPAPIPARKSR